MGQVACSHVWFFLDKDSKGYKDGEWMMRCWENSDLTNEEER